MKDIDITGIVVIAGSYGSGKTETAVNLALYRQKQGIEVSIADLDLINPYFRTRERAKLLEMLGVRVVLPDVQYRHADLPILTPAVAGLIKAPSQLTLLDAGGDDAGVTVLSSLKDSFEGRQVSMLQVVNPLRPFTRNIEGCLKIKAEIEKSAGLAVTGIVGNANLIDETTPDIVYQGYETVMALSEKTGLKIAFITAPADFVDDLDHARFDCPVLPIARELVPPWKKRHQERGV